MIVPAGVFKSTFLKLMDRVAETHETITITKRGHPVARLTPIKSASPKRPLFGYLQGQATIKDDLIAPIGEKWASELSCTTMNSPHRKTLTALS